MGFYASDEDITTRTCGFYELLCIVVIICEIACHKSHITHTQRIMPPFVDKLIVNFSASFSLSLTNKRKSPLVPSWYFKRYSRYLSKIYDADMKQVHAAAIV